MNLKKHPIQIHNIQEAMKVLKGHIHTTDLALSQHISKLAGCPIYLKYENCQRTGSFKIRGGLNKLSALSEKEKSKGIIASSAGNHAQGVAWAANVFSVPSHIVMPQTTPLVKVNATKGYGANVILKGQIYDEAYTHAQDLVQQKGYLFVHPYEDPLIIAGQGTIGLEIAKYLEDVSCVVIPVGGGGLASGIAVAIKALKPKCRVIGVQTVSAPSMTETFQKKQIQVIHPCSSSLADGVSVKTPSEIIYKNYLSRLLDDMVTVNEDEVTQALLFLLERTKTLVEGSGALTVAAVIYRNLSLKGKTVTLLSGGNIDLSLLAKLIQFQPVSLKLSKSPAK